MRRQCRAFDADPSTKFTSAICWERRIAITRRSKWGEAGVLSCRNYALAISMAQLRRDQDKRHQAHHLLTPVYGWFHRRLRHTRPEGGEGPLLNRLMSNSCGNQLHV
jgi:hypothetical protein